MTDRGDERSRVEWLPGLRERVDDWLADDPDPVTREELAGLVERVDDPDPVTRDEVEHQADEAQHDETRPIDPDSAARGGADKAATGSQVMADLVDRFAADLAFGTAGLRGALGAGPNRMNLAVVIRAAAGIVAWLRSSGATRVGADPLTAEAGTGSSAGGPGGSASGAQSFIDVARRGVVIGFDARHRSIDFAEATAAVFAAAGVRALVLPEPLPTPVLAFAVRHLGAAAGVMVTASHNPAADNGYKVYDGSGRQIVAPTDRTIAEAMARIDRVSGVPRTGPVDPDIVRLGDEVVATYVAAAAAVAGLAPPPPVSGREAGAQHPHSHPGPVERPATGALIAYTAMHGVGAATFRRVLAAAGFDPPVEVVEQVEPDPTFPTVAFPNPEEPGALDLGLATARAARAHVLVAHDPDADRLGIAVPDRRDDADTDPDGDGGEDRWRILRGDEIGVILADHLLRTGAIGPGDVLSTSIVSSSLLGKMATGAGRPYVETLTGFKWLSRAADDRPGARLGFAYEEALGFCVGDLVGDKDGITAALVFVDAVARLAEAGRTVLDVLDDLARRHGVHVTGQRSVRVDGASGQAVIADAMVHLRSSVPTELAGAAVTEVVDLVPGATARHLPPSNVVIFHLDGGRVIVRPSGTEPKLKLYVEVVEPVQDDDDLDVVRAEATRRAEALLDSTLGAALPG